MLMEMCLKVTLCMVRLRGVAFSSVPMVLSIAANGSTHRLAPPTIARVM